LVEVGARRRRRLDRYLRNIEVVIDRLRRIGKVEGLDDRRRLLDLGGRLRGNLSGLGRGKYRLRGYLARQRRFELGPCLRLHRHGIAGRTVEAGIAGSGIAAGKRAGSGRDIFGLRLLRGFRGAPAGRFAPARARGRVERACRRIGLPPVRGRIVSTASFKLRLGRPGTLAGRECRLRKRAPLRGRRLRLRYKRSGWGGNWGSNWF